MVSNGEIITPCLYSGFCVAIVFYIIVWQVMNFDCDVCTNVCIYVVRRNLAIGIGIQNFPEGLAVSLPLHAAGVDMWRSFW